MFDEYRPETELAASKHQASCIHGAVPRDVRPPGWSVCWDRTLCWN